VHQDQLDYYIQKSKKIFVWLQLSTTHGFYIKTTKVALTEYLNSLESNIVDDIFIEFGENQELYLGRELSHED